MTDKTPKDGEMLLKDELLKQYDEDLQNIQKQLQELSTTLERNQALVAQQMRMRDALLGEQNALLRQKQKLAAKE